MKGRDNKMEKKKKLSVSTGLCYAGGDVGCNIVFGMIGTLLTLFYTDYVGISAATVGLVMLLSRCFDGFSDLVMGVIVERTNSKWGKSRPWLLWMSIPFALSAVLLEESLLLPHPTAETASTAASARLTNFFIIVSSSNKK